MSRFIWQFDLTGKCWTPKGNWQKGAHKWEIRYFWPVDQVIKLNFDAKQLHWDHGICKIHKDTYLLDMEKQANIKKRDGNLLFKAKIEEKNKRIAYERKVQLSPDELSQFDYVTIPIEKTLIQLTIHQKPKCVLELSKIVVENQIYSSLCIESRCGELLDDLHSHLQLRGNACNYLTFLSNRPS